MKQEKKVEKTLKEKIKETAENLSEKISKKEEKKKELTPEEKIEELEKTIIELKNDKLRALADFENFRKRKEKETFEARDKAVINFVLELLPSIDNFEMSLKMTDNQEMFIKGVEMIHNNLINTLNEHDIKEFEPKIGEKFSPEKHDPILIEVEDKEPGKVLAIVKKGFLHKDKIIRPAKVNVLKEVDEKETQED